MPLDRDQLGSVVPDEYSRYRALVVEALMFFLEQLPGPRRVQIFASQAALPVEATIEQRLVALAHHCPTIHKLGQVLARDRRLSAALRRQLQTLESVTPRTLDPTIRRQLEDHRNQLGLTTLHLGSMPLAEASVSVVVPFSDADATSRRPGPSGVFKVLKPGIERILDEELGVLARLGEWLAERCDLLGIPPLDYGDVFTQVGDLLRMEIRLDQEQRHLEEASRIYAGLSDVVIPRLFPYGTPRITAMERIVGDKVTTLPADPRRTRRARAQVAIEALLAQPLWADVEQAPFHADPHAGNLFWTSDDRLAILDWSLVGRLTKSVRVNLTQVLLHAARGDHDRLCQHVTALSVRPIDPASLGVVVAVALEQLRAGVCLGMRWLTDLLDAVAAQTSATFSGDLTLYRKMLHTLDGVLFDIDPDCAPDIELLGSLARRWCWEWPTRLIAPVWSRAFATHLSTADGASLFWPALGLAKK